MQTRGAFSRFDSTGDVSDGMKIGGEWDVLKSFNSIFAVSLTNSFDKYFYDNLESDPMIYSFGLGPQMMITGTPERYGPLWLQALESRRDRYQQFFCV